MTTILDPQSPEAAEIEKLFDSDPDAIQLEVIADIDCDEDDVELQREEGSEDPMVLITLIAQWNPASRSGLLDWYFLSESKMPEDLDDENAEEDEEFDGLEHGGTLLAFNFAGEEPDFEKLIEASIPALNEAIDWADFSLAEEGDEEE